VPTDFRFFCRLGAWYRQNGHDLDRFPGKDRKVRMPLEQLGRSLMRIRANDHVGAHLITCIFDAALRDFFGLAERSAHANYCGLMFFGPRLPSRYPLLLLRKPFRFGKGIPFHAVIRGFVLLPRNTARNVLFALMRFPFLFPENDCNSRPQTSAIISLRMPGMQAGQIPRAPRTVPA
jgi:hypothetical protein